MSQLVSSAGKHQYSLTNQHSSLVPITADLLLNEGPVCTYFKSLMFSLAKIQSVWLQVHGGLR